MIKRISFFIFLCICLSLSAYADGERNIRVGLYYGNTAKQSVEINVDGEVKTYTGADFDIQMDFYPTQFIKVNGTEYKGYITLKKNDGGLITVINTVDLEDYLCAVLPREMSPSFEIEALKAQAVAARTYALKKIGKHEKYGFDVCASIDCQVYGGASCENEKTSKAVYATKGETINYNNSLIDAVYFASSGGYTESAVNVWGTDFPYLQSVSDEYEESGVYGHEWTKELTVQKATQIMSEHGYNIGTVKEIRVDEISDSGGVVKLTVVGSSGEKTFTKESCRNIFSEYTLSQAYTVSTKGENSRLYTLDGVIDKSNMYLLSYNGVSKFVQNSISVADKGKTVNTTLCDVSSFVFCGRGYGHLVGMSQNGANGMAKNGYTYIQILKHYYKGTEIN